NQGTISAQSAREIDINGANWSNTGTIQASNGGTIGFLTLPSNYSSSTLTGGHWYVFNGSTMNFGSSSITINAADVRLDGATSSFASITNLATNNGTFTIGNGRSFSFAGTVTNNGAITAASGGTIIIPGG